MKEVNMDKQFKTRITAKRKSPKVRFSIFNVPEDGGIYCFSINNPAIQIAPIIGINLPTNIATQVVRFQKIVLFPKPENSERSEEHTSELQSLRHLVCR